jgi:hypothetical protein
MDASSSFTLLSTDLLGLIPDVVDIFPVLMNLSINVPKLYQTMA